MRTLNTRRVLSLPGTPEQDVLYFIKKPSGELNVAMADSTGTRPALANREVRLSGPQQILKSLEGTPRTGAYTIVNYDSFKEYTVSVSAGSVVRSGNTITVTAPLVAGAIYLTINGENSKITITNS